MAKDCPFKSARLRALALATEVEERVLEAVRFASASEDVKVVRTSGHFGTPISIIEAELGKARDIRRFLAHVDGLGIRAALAGQAEARVDDERVFHFRLDKQQAYLGTLALATGKDVIDVTLKVAVYPASREAAVQAVGAWLAAAPEGAGSKIL